MAGGWWLPIREDLLGKLRSPIFQTRSVWLKQARGPRPPKFGALNALAISGVRRFNIHPFHRTIPPFSLLASQANLTRPARPIGDALRLETPAPVPRSGH